MYPDLGDVPGGVAKRNRILEDASIMRRNVHRKVPSKVDHSPTDYGKTFTAKQEWN